MQIKDINTLDDLALVNLYKQTNSNAYVGVLFQRYSHLILGVCIKYLGNEEDAKDASISIFEKLLSDLPRFEIENFKSWLHACCKTFCLMQIRAAKSKYAIENKIDNNLEDVMESNKNVHLTYEENNELHFSQMEECMQGLNEHQRLCIELFFLKEKSYKEVTDETNMTLNMVKSHIQNGKRNLKNCMESKLL